MFEFIKLAPSDPVLSLSNLYKSDQRKNKINLGIGVYMDKFGNTPILKSVKKAEKKLLDQEITKNYLNIEGINSFNAATQSLLFGENDTVISKKNTNTVQAIGGTGALRIAADFIINNTNARRVWISSPSWINHKNIFLAAGFEVCHYPYYNAITHTINFDELYENLKKVKNNDVVVLHGCCHNPTGIDPNIDQWNILSELSAQNKWLPLFDIAYQGFSVNLKKDLQGLHIFCKKNIELIVCNSYSKNFGLYNERIGACTVVTNNNKNSENILSQLRSIIRANYSNPPAHGASIISIILHDKILRAEWEQELQCMRKNIQYMRELLTHTLHINNSNKDFSFIAKQKGMFCFMGLRNEDVIRLREKLGIYLVDSGRINLSGLSNNNVSQVSNAITKIYKKNYHEINVI